jgi:methyl-accepting chemotaxis protein
MQLFNDLNISKKLLSGFILIALITVVVGWRGYRGMISVGENQDELYMKNFLILNKVSSANAAILTARGDVRNMMAADDAAGRQKYAGLIQEQSAAAEKYLTSISKDDLKADEAVIYDKLLASWNTYKGLRDKALPLALAMDDEGALKILDVDARASLTETRKHLQELNECFLANADMLDQETDGSLRSSALQLVIMIVIGTGLAVGAGVIISRLITKPLAEGVVMMEKLSKGNLSARLKMGRNDEIGKLANGMDFFADTLSGFVGGMYQVADGNLSIDIHKQGVDDEISPGLISIIASLRALAAETTMLTQAAIEGHLETRGNAANFKGGYRAIIEGVNETLDKVILPVKQGADALAQLAGGDLTVRVTGEYKGDHGLIITSINSLAESLDRALADVTEAVSATASASTEISSSTEEMAAGAQEQTQQAAEVASAVEEMTKTIMDTTKNASEAASTAKHAGASAKEGGRVVMETMEGMARIADVVKQSASTVQALGRSSDQIGEIVQVIDDIADQTNLLALNAAIEAARAGEQGRGFAVVADEVRKLAERTTKATKEIAMMIKQIQKDTTGAVESMNRGTVEVEKGRLLAEQSSVSLKEIINGAEKVVDVVTQVAAASEEQSSASEQISKNIEAISSVTQESASGTQQIARAAEDLNRLTSNLQELLGQFTISSQKTTGARREDRGRMLVHSNGKHLHS